jgi:hypothetical protein
MQVEDQDILMRYLDGEMDPVETENFRQRLTGDTELQSELERLQAARQAIRSHAITKQVEAIHQEMMGELSAPQTSKVVRMERSKKIIRFSLRIAAAIFLLVFGFLAYQFVTLSPDKIYSEQFIPYEVPATRGTEEVNQSPIDSAYKQKNYSAVIVLRKKAATLTAREQFLSGISFLELNDAMSAIVAFKAAINLNKASAEQAYQDESEYYLALAYLKNGDYDQALVLMRAVRANPAHLYHDAFSEACLRKVSWLKWR